VKRTVGQEVLREHLAAGLIVRIGGGKRGDPYRYWRPAPGDDGQAEKLSAAAPVVPAESNGHHAYEDEKLSAALKVEVPAERNGSRDRSSVEDGVSATTSGSVEAEELSAATPILRAAERNDTDDFGDLFVAVVAECRGCGGSVDSGQAYCFACDSR